MKRFYKFWLGALVYAPLLHPALVWAQTPQKTINDSLCTVNGEACKRSLFSSDGLFRRITNTLIFIVGAVAVLMVIIGALRYTLSGGDPAGVKGAKDTILFAIIGVIVAILAFAIVNFVLVNVR